MALGFVTKLMLVISLALFASAGLHLAQTLDEEDEARITAMATAQPGNTTLAATKVVVGDFMTTPAWQFEWRGDPDEKTFMLEDIPFPDNTDALFLVPVWLVFLAIVRYLWRTDMAWYNVVAIALILFIFGTLLVWAIAKLIVYYAMLDGARELGIEQQVIESRHTSIQAAHESGATNWLFILAGINLAVLVAALWPKGGDDE